MLNCKFSGYKTEHLIFLEVRHNLLTINIDVFYMVYYNI